MGWINLICVWLCVVAHTFAQGASKKYVIEVYFVFDTEAFANYEREKFNTALVDAIKDMDYFLTLANERLATLQKYDLDIQLKILKTERTSGIYQSSGTGTNSPTDMLEAFNSWLETTQTKERIGYDVAVYFTGQKLPADSIGAQKGTICEDSSRYPEYPVIVVPFDGSFFVVNALLKNIGFILGAGKDGSGSDNIMRSSSKPLGSAEIFAFSRCTAFDIKEFFAARDVSCLLKTSSSGNFPNTSPQFYTGRAVDPNLLCSRMISPKSVVCHAPNLWGVKELAGDPVCQRLYCTEDDDFFMCNRRWPPEGMPCNPNKVCRSGKCVDDYWGRIDDVYEGCAYGDTKADLNRQGSTCASAFAEDGSPMCYTFGVKCCRTCHKYKTSYKDCEYGDKSLFVGGIKSSCDDYLARYGMRKCLDSVVAGICCGSCGDWKANSQGKRGFEANPITYENVFPDAYSGDEESSGTLDPRLTTLDDDGLIVSTPKIRKEPEVHELLQEPVDIED
ncbi:hypothetical protein RRG08_019184 [Elysia crispata]|uniref:Peptidase M12B domain-containing protein n=1 Tax=Elysia crispata TaxID=231223 RepID=A0AAE1DN62_9GAST|nr:hypothetical protein RRG08_019184 [Elysia crispata]